MDIPIALAIGRSTPGRKIRLQPGTYREGVQITKAIELWGESPGAVSLQGPSNQPALLVETDAVVSGLSIEGSDTPGAVAVRVSSGRLQMENCELSSNRLTICVAGPTAELLLRGCRILRSGFAIEVSNGARLRMEDCEISGTRLFALVVKQRAAATIVRTRFAETRLGGVVVQEESQASFETCEFADNPAPAENQPLLEAQLQVDGSHVRMHQCWLHGGTGCGILLGERANLNMAQCRITGHGKAGVQVGANSYLTLEECQIEANRGAGLIVADGGRAAGTDVVCADNGAAGIAVMNQGIVEMKKTRVRGNLVGMVLMRGARASLVECDLTENTQGPIRADADCPVDLSQTKY
ncbi:MAG: right-handed parallel beta-helix repeat-containing protein [Planctomycetales bacterium]